MNIILKQCLHSELEHYLVGNTNIDIFMRLNRENWKAVILQWPELTLSEDFIFLIIRMWTFTDILFTSILQLHFKDDFSLKFYTSETFISNFYAQTDVKFSVKLSLITQSSLEDKDSNFNVHNCVKTVIKQKTCMVTSNFVDNCRCNRKH